MKNKKKSMHSKPLLPAGVKRGYRFYAVIVLAVTLALCFSVTAFAATSPPTVSGLNNT